MPPNKIWGIIKSNCSSVRSFVCLSIQTLSAFGGICHNLWPNSYLEYYPAFQGLLQYFLFLQRKASGRRRLEETRKKARAGTLMMTLSCPPTLTRPQLCLQEERASLSRPPRALVRDRWVWHVLSFRSGAHFIKLRRVKTIIYDSK